MKHNLRVWMLCGTILLLLVCGGIYLLSLRKHIAEKRLTVAELQQQLGALRAERMALQTLQLHGREFTPLPYSSDPVTNEILLRAALIDLMAAHGLRGTIYVHAMERDTVLPETAEVESVPIAVGIEDYLEYAQVVAFVDELNRFAIVVDEFCFGCTEIGVPGRVRMQLRYFVPAV